MLLFPLHTRLLKKGDDIASLLQSSRPITEGDIVVLSSKAVATVEGVAIALDTTTPSQEARNWSQKCGRSAAFCEAVLTEIHRLHGNIIGTCPGALLTELRPDGLTEGTIFAANAGLDQSNVEDGFAIGWPRDPVQSVRALRTMLETSLRRTATEVTDGTEVTKDLYSPFHSSVASVSSESSVSQNVAVILSDSCCIPRRRGVTAHALVVSGIDPLFSEIGNRDLFGKPLRITIEARADQLATAANILMGNAGQSIPAVIIRDHGLPLGNYEGWVPGIEPEEDLFQGIFGFPSPLGGG